MATITSATDGSESFVLHGISWQTYESILKDYEKYSGIRLNFNKGKLQIMVPGPDHEWAEQQVTDVVKTSSETWDTDIASYGSTTFRREDLERGFEPDSCFYIRHAEQMRGRRVIDLTVDPAPELVIEIDDTHSSLDKMDIYARVGVGEVWRWRNNAMTIFALENGVYTERTASVAFPTLTPDVLNELVAASRTMRRPDWVRHVREWARQNPPPQNV